jgi:hypothetical protein
MVLARLRVLRDPERLLRSLCRCDGLKDMAVVAALLVLAAALAVRLGAVRVAVSSLF